ncbi:MAG: prepilin-type N-terminal cleavage/methylation domain-containing protein [Candidatus Wallbacteria bacterium]|nr:prepilin-type N-terminal cleavage/methylation domain-containing protein [Candidatus Wallbacteria bacterium]
MSVAAVRLAVSGTRARGFSLIEVVIGVGIFAAALVPMMDLVTSSTRMSVSAGRMLEATLHGQTLLQALAELEPAEFPPVATGDETVVLQDGASAAPGQGPRWQALAAYYARPTSFAMQRRALARRLAGGELAVRVEIVWTSTPGEADRTQTVSLQTLSTPRNWD